MSSKRDTYVAKMKSTLDEMNTSMAELESRANDAGDAAMDQYNEQLAKLRAHSKTAVTQFEELQAASEASWHKMVGEMEKVRSAFTDSFKYFKARV